MYAFAVTSQDLAELSTRFQISISAAKVSADVIAVGEDLCETDERSICYNRKP